jgi:hypothetical protein
MNALLPCLRVMVASDEFSYLCSLTSEQMVELCGCVPSYSLTPARVGMAFVRSGEGTDWFPVSVGNNPHHDAALEELETASGTLSLLRLGDAELLELGVPERWCEGADCLIEFRSHTALPAPVHS